MVWVLWEMDLVRKTEMEMEVVWVVEMVVWKTEIEMEEVVWEMEVKVVVVVKMD
ncbi:hypothetical protein L195_g051525 [Trifolium pratense]|uniref:Uncharacterized protein n=1 Tax=Trifolium pratense TaxID=57577 RepID=A0A2K3K062_TRIPR|nr:hypothetical protein L195_g051525 [Trifolium pratense]